MKEKTLKQLELELYELQNVDYHPKIIALKKIILAERQPEINKLKTEIERLKEIKNNIPKKTRWPEDTPEEILKRCKSYWSGTVEYNEFRIHCWNDKAVWTSYPSGGYSSNGGWNPTPASFHLISLTELNHHKPIRLIELEGRVSNKKMLDLLKIEFP